MTAPVGIKVRSLVIFVGLLASIADSSQVEAVNSSSPKSLVQRRIATVGNPDNYMTSGFNGVARLAGQESQNRSCAASLLNTGLHLLTASHCIFGFNPPDYVLNFGEIRLSAAKYFIHPEYNHSKVANDIAIIELASEAPKFLTRYDIYPNNDEVGKIFNLVGYGALGTGEGGAGLSPADFDYQKRVGQNSYDALGEILDGLIPGFSILPGTQLAYDFDSGRPEQDAFGVVFGSEYADLGLGLNEVNSALADSGAPTFIDGAIAGITSYGFGADLSKNLLLTDVTPTVTDSGFGEISVDTRVSFYAAWIDSVLRGDNPVSIPEPSPLAGLTIVGASFLLKRYRSEKK
jgi:hypothetical protein